MRPDAGEHNAAGEGQTGREATRPGPDLEPRPLDLTSAQFTLRAVLSGMLLGGLLSTCNVYVGLKIGTAFGMSITAALLGYGFWAGLRGLSGRRIHPLGILENNINQTACSAGASVASAGLVAPIPALALLTGQTLEWHYLALWVLSVMLVGIAVAVPLRRQMVVTDKLPFPAGIASAEMLRELHARGEEALARVKVLIASGLVSVAAKLCVTVCARFQIPVSYALPFSIKGTSARALTMTLSPSLLLVAIGGLIGLRACCSLLLGALLAYGVVSPELLAGGHVRPAVSAPLAVLPAGVEFPPEDRGHARYDAQQQALAWSGRMTEAERNELRARSDDPAYREAVQALHVRSQSAQPSFADLNRWLLWPGVTLMVVGALVSLCFAWRSIVAAFSGPKGNTPGAAGPVDTREVRRPWFGLGLLVVLIFSVVLQVSLFGIVWWVAVIAVLLAFALALVAARVSGETGIGSVGPMGKVSQLAFGALVPGNPVPNLMAANVTGGAASQCADLLDDLKCGYLLGASPRLQTLAQLCGAVAGALVGSAAYLILIPDPAEMLLTEEWAAPAVTTWKTVAEMFMVGFTALPPGTPTALALAALAGVVLPVLERAGPRALRPLVPSAVSLGLAFVLPAGIAISIFIGGLIAFLLRRWFKRWSTRFLVAICTGAIVGESLAGIGVALESILTR